MAPRGFGLFLCFFMAGGIAAVQTYLKEPPALRRASTRFLFWFILIGGAMLSFWLVWDVPS
jgi:hypothetical protein